MKLQCPPTRAQYVVIEYYGRGICNIANVADHEAAKVFVNNSETECTHRTLVNLDDRAVVDRNDEGSSMVCAEYN
jgi:hypothetical protein